MAGQKSQAYLVIDWKQPLNATDTLIWGNAAGFCRFSWQPVTSCYLVCLQRETWESVLLHHSVKFLPREASRQNSVVRSKAESAAYYVLLKCVQRWVYVWHSLPYVFVDDPVCPKSNCAIMWFCKAWLYVNLLTQCQQAHPFSITVTSCRSNDLDYHILLSTFVHQNHIICQVFRTTLINNANIMKI